MPIQDDPIPQPFMHCCCAPQGAAAPVSGEAKPKASPKNSSRMPFRLTGSLEGGPDMIILDRDGKEVGELYVDTWEEAREIVDAINSVLNPAAADLAEAVAAAGAAFTRGL